MPSIVNPAGIAVSPIAPPPALPWRVKSRAVRQRYRNWLRRTRAEDLSATDLARLLSRPVRTVAAGVRWATLDEEYRQAGPDAWLRSNPDAASGDLNLDDVLYLIETYGSGHDLGSDPSFRAFLTPIVSRIVRRWPSLTGLRLWLEAPTANEPAASRPAAA